MRQVVIRILNHLVQSESWAQERLRQHAGAKLLVAAGRLNIGLSIDESGLFRVNDTPAVPDVTLTLPAESAFAALLEREKLFSSVKLDGSVEVAETLAFVFRNLKWDAEGDLAEVVGDIPARRLTKAGKAVLSGVQGSLAKATENITEYVVGDSRFVVSEKDLAAFGKDVNDLRDDLARLEMRVSRL